MLVVICADLSDTLFVMFILIFVLVSPPLSDYQKEECTSTLEMMYRYTNPYRMISQCDPLNTCFFSCPFPFELDVGEIVVGFCSIDLHTHALASLLIVPSQAERSHLLSVSSQLLQNLTSAEHAVFFNDCLVYIF